MPSRRRPGSLGRHMMLRTLAVGCVSPREDSSCKLRGFVEGQASEVSFRPPKWPQCGRNRAKAGRARPELKRDRPHIRRFWAKAWPMSVGDVPSLSMSSRIRSNSAQTCRFRAKLSQVAPNRSNFTRNISSTAQVRPNFADSGTNLAETGRIGPSLAELGSFKGKLGGSRPKTGLCGPSVSSPELPPQTYVYPITTEGMIERTQIKRTASERARRGWPRRGRQETMWPFLQLFSSAPSIACSGPFHGSDLGLAFLGSPRALATQEVALHKLHVFSPKAEPGTNGLLTPSKPLPAWILARIVATIELWGPRRRVLGVARGDGGGAREGLQQQPTTVSAPDSRPPSPLAFRSTFTSSDPEIRPPLGGQTPNSVRPAAAELSRIYPELPPQTYCAFSLCA